MPVWRRSRLRTVRLHRIDGIGRRRPPSRCRAPYRRAPLHGFGSIGKRVEKSSESFISKTFRHNTTLAVPYSRTLAFEVDLPLLSKKAQSSVSGHDFSRALTHNYLGTSNVCNPIPHSSSIPCS